MPEKDENREWRNWTVHGNSWDFVLLGIEKLLEPSELENYLEIVVGKILE